MFFVVNSRRRSYAIQAPITATTTVKGVDMATTRSTAARTASLDSVSSKASSSDDSILSKASSSSTANTSLSPSVILAPRKGWASAASELRPRPSHVDRSAPLTPLPPHSSGLATRPPDRAFDHDPDYVPYPDDPYCLRHAEFGHDENQQYRWTGYYKAGREATGRTRDGKAEVPVEDVKTSEPLQEPSLYIYLVTYSSYLMLIVVGSVPLLSLCHSPH